MLAPREAIETWVTQISGAHTLYHPRDSTALLSISTATARWINSILTIKREVIPLKRVRGNQKAMQAFIEEFTATSRDARSLRVGIAHAEAPDRARQLEKMARGERPQAQIELVTDLGAVVGTHAGPGTVGFFWFDDGE